MPKSNGLSLRQGLYHPQFEYDACGIRREKSHRIVTEAIELLGRLNHCGGVGSEPETGDGAGIQLHHRLQRDAATAAAARRPYREWLEQGLVQLRDLSPAEDGGDGWEDIIRRLRAAGSAAPYDHAAGGQSAEQEPSLLLQQKIFGYTWEDLILPWGVSVKRGRTRSPPWGPIHRWQ